VRLTSYQQQTEPPFIDLKHKVILTQADTEIITRFSTSIESKRTIFTDLNGLSMSERKRRDDLPIQHNVFPMSETVFIQDDNHRMTIVSRQAVGTASMSNGMHTCYWIDRPPRFTNLML